MKILPRFSTAQLMLIAAWICIAVALMYESTFPESRVQACSEIAVSANGELVAIGGLLDTRIYRNAKHLATIPRHSAVSEGMSFIRFVDDETLGVIDNQSYQYSCGVYFYSIAERKIVRHLPLDDDTERAIFLSDKILVQQFHMAFPSKHSFRLFDINADQDSEPISTYPSPHASVSMAATNDGRFVAFFWGNKEVEFLENFMDGVHRLYDTHSQVEIGKLPPANGIRFSPDNSKVVVCGREISLFDWPDLTKNWTIESKPCHNIHFAPDGTRFGVLTLDDDRLLVFESESGNQLTEIKLDPNKGTGFAFANDGKSIWVPAQDDLGGIQEWDIASGGMDRRIGNSNVRSRWILFFVLLLVWAFLYSLVDTSFPKLPPDWKPTKFGWSISILTLTVGCFFLSFGISHCFESLALYQHDSLFNYFFTLSLVAIPLLLANLIPMIGFSGLVNLRELSDAMTESTS